VPKRDPWKLPKRFWDSSGSTISYSKEPGSKRVKYAVKKRSVRDIAAILLGELVVDLKYRDASVFINGARFTPSARELEDIGSDPGNFGLESTHKRKAKKKAKRTEKSRELENEGVKGLVKKLKTSTDASEKKRIRRALRKLGHKGGAGKGK